MLSHDCDFILLVNSLESSLFSPGCCKSVTLWSDSYEATEEEHEGAPLYRQRNSRGEYLYRYSDGTWRVGLKIGDSGLVKSVGTAQCPANISQWEFWADPNWFSSDGLITVECN